MPTNVGDATRLGVVPIQPKTKDEHEMMLAVGHQQHQCQ
jgi:hypothetical protein